MKLNADDANTGDRSRLPDNPAQLIKPRSSVTAESFDDKSPLKPAEEDDHNDGDEIDVVRQKLMLDLRVSADKLKLSFFDERNRPKPKPKEATDSNPDRPWNLRTRRAACRAPLNDSAGGGSNDSPSPVRYESPAATTKSSRLRGLATAAATVGKLSAEKGERSERAKFSVSLSRAEVESDFLAMVGSSPPRRPKKRNRTIQKQLDCYAVSGVCSHFFPGMWLTEVTPDRYKIPDIPEQTEV
ncbi:hypothetical protein RJ639_013054 [Escallonia herrerae]|uniref:Uncharacterized protein n=1 Tax=Escallonia herrerae TaxID=1293975 RepID=A0AA88VN05_9ASTE|nr:hypothetical protein RJ639_013054 [Escallonia herrerae]